MFELLIFIVQAKCNFNTIRLLDTSDLNKAVKLSVINSNIYVAEIFTNLILTKVIWDVIDIINTPLFSNISD